MDLLSEQQTSGPAQSVNIKDAYNILSDRMSRSKKPATLDKNEQCQWPLFIISMEDIKGALRTSNPKSRPGPDAIDRKILKSMDPRMLRKLFVLWTFAQDVPKCLKISRTILIPKAGRPSSHPDNHRPISISSMVYRLFSRVINGYLQKSINLCHAQKAFMSGIDGCSENITMLMTCIKEARRQKSGLACATLDIAKAFDTIQHGSIQQALERQHIAPPFLSLLMNMLSGCSTFLQVNGRQSKEFNIGCGVKQGDPLSPTLFNVVMDELMESLV